MARLLIRLMDTTESLGSISQERSSNMSKMSQKLLSENQASFLQLPIWDGPTPCFLSPRTSALKCLEIMVRKMREAGDTGDVISKELSNKLFCILRSSSATAFTDDQRKQETVDFQLALSTLESHSIKAMTCSDESIWIHEYLPILSNILCCLLKRFDGDAAPLQLLALRLTLNVTNNNPEASKIFATEELVFVLSGAVISKFKLLSGFLLEDERLAAIDHLILTLGVMINFAEWSPSSRRCLQAHEGNSQDPLEGLVQIFVDKQKITAEADSVEETIQNVAFGYLSVLLGFLSLLPDIEQRLRSRQPTKSLRPLLGSIEEFISHNKTVDDLLEADIDGHNPQVGLTDRLQRMVDELSTRKGI